jgi:hypothetical protein
MATPLDNFRACGLVLGQVHLSNMNVATPWSETSGLRQTLPRLVLELVFGFFSVTTSHFMLSQIIFKLYTPSHAQLWISFPSAHHTGHKR